MHMGIFLLILDKSICIRPFVRRLIKSATSDKLLELVCWVFHYKGWDSGIWRKNIKNGQKLNRSCNLHAKDPKTLNFT